MNRRARYPDNRKYKSWQLKRLIRELECKHLDLEKNLYSDSDQKNIKDCQEIVLEIALRLD